MGEGTGGRHLGFAYEAGFIEAGESKVKAPLSSTHGSPFGRRRMCYAQTAAPEGKRQEEWECKSVVAAVFKAVRNEHTNVRRC